MKPLDPFDPRIALAPLPFVRIPLDNFGCYWAKVSEEDAIWLRQWVWCAHFDPRGKLYAAREERTGSRRSRIYMHREILQRIEAQPSEKQCLVDHRDSDGTNNTRGNLRWATHQENARNLHGLVTVQGVLAELGRV